jgi:hypothetical protein
VQLGAARSCGKHCGTQAVVAACNKITAPLVPPSTSIRYHDRPRFNSRRLLTQILVFMISSVSRTLRASPTCQQVYVEARLCLAR